MVWIFHEEQTNQQIFSEIQFRKQFQLILQCLLLDCGEQNVENVGWLVYLIF